MTATQAVVPRKDPAMDTLPTGTVNAANGSATPALDGTGTPTPATPALSVKGLSKGYGAGDQERRVIEGLDLDVAAGEFLRIVGPSGVGKTTLLRCLSGLLEPSAGTVTLEGRLVTRPPDTLAVVFQDYARSLLPWMSIWKNVELPLKGKGLGKGRDRTALHRRIELGRANAPATRTPRHRRRRSTGSVPTARSRCDSSNWRR